MAKMWAGRFSKEVDETVNAFNSSIAFDGRMYTFKGIVEQYVIKLREQADAYDKADQDAVMRLSK